MITHRYLPLYCAWLFALLGTMASLYFSHVRGLEPCHLCWDQRIALFPLALILGVATFRGDLKIAFYTLPFALIGLLFALYQVAIQEIPGWNPIELCGGGPSCSEKTSLGMGWITLPMLSSLNFLLLSLLLGLVWRQAAYKE